MAFIEQISDYITTHYDLTKENITVVFPNKRAALQLRNELGKRIPYNSWVPNIVSIQQAMEEWSELQLIDNIDVVFELIKINDAFHNNSELNNSFFGLAVQMAKDFDEIDQYNVDAENLFKNLTSAKEIEDWNFDSNSKTESNFVKFFESLIQYYNALINSIIDKGFGYYGLITRKIATYDDETLLQKTKGKKIIFAGFNALTTTEENVIVRLVEKCNAVMLWDLDNYYFKDETQEAGYFARKFFERHPNFEKNFIGDNFENSKKKINVINVSGSGIQPNAFQLQYEKEIKEETVKKSDKCVVVLADESLLIPTLNFIPDSVEKIDVTMGYPYSKTITYHFINQLFKYKKSLSSNSEKIYLWNFIKLCNSDFIKQVFKGKDYNSLVNWLGRLTKNSQYYFNINDLNDAGISTELIDFLEIILTKCENVNDFIESINNLLEISFKKIDSINNNFVKNQISVASSIANRIKLLVSKYSNYIQMIDLQVLFTQVANQSTLKLNEKEDNQQEDEKAKENSLSLQIMGLLETRNLDFDVVHFLSVNEGILPLSKNNNSLIPYDLRRAFNLPTYKHQQAVYAYHFFRLLQNAKIVNLYYNSLAEKSGQGEPSRFISQIEYEYAKNNVNAELNHIQYKSPKINNNNSIIEIEKTPEILDKIKTFSPTSISEFINCPLQYYFKHVERINDDIPEEEIQVNQIGSIIHRTLENLYKIFGDDIITSEKFDSVCRENFDKCFKEALEHNKFKSGLPDTGFNCLSKTMINSMLENFIRKEKEFILNGENGTEKYKMSVIGLEKNFEYGFEFNGKTITLTGNADRIDKINDKIRIIDYKTGGVEKSNVIVNEKQTELSMMDKKSVQLLIYKYLYLKENPKQNPNNVEPGIFGLKNLSNGIFELNASKNPDFENDFMKSCEDYLTRFFETVFDSKTRFTQTDDINNCKYCNFTSICKRERK